MVTQEIRPPFRWRARNQYYAAIAGKIYWFYFRQFYLKTALHTIQLQFILEQQIWSCWHKVFLSITLFFNILNHFLNIQKHILIRQFGARLYARLDSARFSQIDFRHYTAIIWTANKWASFVDRVFERQANSLKILWLIRLTNKIVLQALAEQLGRFLSVISYL